MKKLTAGVLLCVTSLSLMFCGVSSGEYVYSKESEPVQLTNEFNLLEKMPQDKNFMFSPLSIKLAFMLAANGSENGTQKEILSAFGISDLNKSNLEFKKTVESLTKSGTVNIANSVWLNTGYAGKNVKFNDEYLKKIKNYFNAEAKEVNDRNAVDTINTWVNNKTKGKIDSIIDDPEFLSVLINAIHFKADWAKEFKKEDTQKRTFTNKNGSKKQVDFMHQKGTFNYFEDDNLQLLEMEYKNTDLSMYVVLPKIGKEITPENLQKAMKNKKSERVNISLPKFKTETELELSKTMKALGIQTAFRTDCPDFRDVMFKNMPKDLMAYISKVIHKSFIEVDEKGTEAAAVTAIVMKCSCCLSRQEFYKDFNADHPFKYLIKDNKSGEVLFMGEQAFFN